MIVFDIETRPLPYERLQELCPPFDPSSISDPGEWDPDAVKTGNLKDPQKIADKIEAARLAHVEAVEKYADRMRQAEDEHFAAFASKAGLSAATAQVLCIGVYSPAKDIFQIIGCDEDEAAGLTTWWELFRRIVKDGRSLVGVNIIDFDLPFLVQRSWINGVTVPGLAVEFRGKWPNWHRSFVDLRRLWQMGRTDERSSFDWIGKALGSNGKVVEGVSGATFWQTWETDHEAALEYLRHDVMAPAEWAQRMGVTE